jgi:hypothetical protein
MSTVTRGNRKDQSAITVTIDGLDTGGVWEKKTGGAIDSDDTKIYPGARQAPQSLGGKQLPENITLVRTFDLDRDLPKIKGWMNRAGKASVVVKDQPLDADDNAFGAPLVQSGKLKMVSGIDRDSEDSGAAQVSLEVSIDGTVG